MKLFYVYDALCGWCYGFSPVIKNFYDKVKEELPLEVISGGMVMGEREGPIGKMAPYIKKSYKIVEERTGVKFGAAFLEELEKGELHFTSYPPSKAMGAFKMMKDTEQVDFAHAIQQAIYFEGREPDNLNTYLNIVKDFKVNPKSFSHHYNLPATEEVVLQDFHLTQQLGVKGFPNVFIEENNKFIMIAHGYTEESQLQENYQKGKELLLKERDK